MYISEKQKEVSMGSVLQDKACQIHGGNCISDSCCTNDNYVNNLCGTPELACCVSETNCNWTSSIAGISD